MTNDKPLSDSPILRDIKERGRHAFAEFRRLIREMEKHAAAVRHDASVMRYDNRLR